MSQPWGHLPPRKITPISRHPSISGKLAALGGVAWGEWFWDAYMREGSATCFAVLPERVTGRRSQAAFLYTSQSSSRGKCRPPIRQKCHAARRQGYGGVLRVGGSMPHGRPIENITPGGGSPPNALAAGRRIGQSSSIPSRYSSRQRPTGRSASSRYPGLPV
jgi:hypothetical protein